MSKARAGGAARVQAASTSGCSRSTTPSDRIPYGRRRGGVALQLLAGRRSTRAACGGAPRWPNTARPSPRGRRCSTSTRSARPRTRTGSGRARNCLLSGLRALPGLAVARRRRRGRCARVRRRPPKSLREGRLRAAGGEERRRLDATRTRSMSAPTSARARMTESGYPRIVKEWKRGTPLAEATHGLRGRAERRRRRASTYRHDHGRRYDDRAARDSPSATPRTTCCAGEQARASSTCRDDARRSASSTSWL